MAAMAGLLNHARTASQALSGPAANPMAAAATSTTSSTNSSSGSSATISSNDFLTLLVTEMQNQDPTADTDPNEYINQLVQVNSLEQLISINQNLSTALGIGSSGNSGNGTGVIQAPAGTPGAGSAAAATAHPAKSTAGTNAGGSSTAAAINRFVESQSKPPARAGSVPGNLSVPPAHAAAHRVAHALDGQTPSPRTPGKRIAGQ
jgi:flagellar basal-body rod modification protein FlgD